MKFLIHLSYKPTKLGLLVVSATIKVTEIAHSKLL